MRSDELQESGGIRTHTAGPGAVHVVSDERVRIFLRCVFDTRLTILQRLPVSTLLPVHVMFESRRRM